jgi:hypothetical protein
MTAPNGPILFNSSTGNDATASGLGAANVYGSGASTTGSSAVVTGIDTTGVSSGDLLWVQSSSGRQFSIIATVDSSTQVTCDDTFANTESSRTWAIGGKRATFDNADSRNVFSQSLLDWVIETETNQTITSSIQGTGRQITIKSSSDDIRTITVSADAEALRGGTYWLENLKFQCSASTTKSVWLWDNGTQYTHVVAKKCVFGDASNSFYTLTLGGGVFNSFIKLYQCDIQYMTNVGFIYNYGNQMHLDGCRIRNNASSGIALTGVYGSNLLTVNNCIFEGNGGHGLSSGRAQQTSITNSIFYNNVLNGVNIGIEQPQAVANCIFANNLGYGYAGILGGNRGSGVMGNAFYNNGLGPYYNREAADIFGDNIDLDYDPFVDAANGDLNLNSNAGGGSTLRANNYTLNTDTSVYPFRQYVSDDFDSGAGGGATVHPLYAN